MRRVLRDNGLTLALLAMFMFSFVGQAIAGRLVHNRDARQHGEPQVSFVEYLGTPAFLEATAENWESEFLQMGVFVLLTAFLFQRGSAESNDPDEHSVDEGLSEADLKDAPWPVRRGGIALGLYSHSLSIVFMTLFAVSFVLHAVGGAGEFNQELLAHGDPPVSTLRYVGTSQFWFESLQNWQSEFLSIAAMVFFTIFLRERGSPESKQVHAPHSQTGA